jgi:type IV secretory pathway VirB10-like protein
VLIVLAALVVLAGCGESSADKAKSQVCSARDDIAKQVKQLQGLTLTTATTSQVSDSLKAIQSDLSTISKASGDLGAGFKQDVRAANDQFTSSVKDTASGLGKTVSLEEARTQLTTAFDRLATSYKSSFGTLKCG